MTRGSLKASQEGITRANQALTRKGLTQKALAENLGIARSTVSRFFNSRSVDRSIFLEICKWLGLDWEEIFAIPVDEPESNENQSVLYMERVPDESRCYEEILKPGALLRIKAPLQMGKTLLMSRVLKYTANHRYRTVALNLRYTTPEDFSNLDKFLQWFCTSVAVMLGLTAPVDEHWSRSLGNSKIKCRTYFEKYLLPGDSAVVLALDEVELLYPYQEIAGEFLGMLRTWHEDAKTSRLWEQLRLLVLYTEVYTQLDINQSPFNAGMEIKLTDLSFDQVQYLSRQFGLDWGTTQVKQLMAFVGGHPYLVRKALSKVAQQEITLDQLLYTAANEAGIYRDHLERHLRKLQQHPQLSTALKKVVTADVPLQLNSTLNPDMAVKLDDLGLVKLQSNTAMPRYELYRQYFRNRLGDNT